MSETWVRDAAKEISQWAYSRTAGCSLSIQGVEEIILRHAPGILGASPRTLEHWTNIRAEDLADIKALKLEIHRLTNTLGYLSKYGCLGGREKQVVEMTLVGKDMSDVLREIKEECDNV